MSKDLVLEKNPEPSRGHVVIPGISSGPFGSPFDEAVEQISESYSIVRINTWNGAEDLEKMALKNLHGLIDEACELLKSNDCESISVLGKSFGGQLALTYPENNVFEKMVLWAPAVGFGENTVEKWRSTLLEHAQTPADISVDSNHLRDINSKVKIIHGTEDKVVDMENSRKICEFLPRCEFSKIKNTGHSFEDSYQELISKTTTYL